MMSDEHNFTARVFHKNKGIILSTVSPNGKFSYKIRGTTDLYWGAYCTRIAFFDGEGSLLYHSKDQYAQFGLGTKEWELVSWSLSGNFAFFIERNSIKSYHYVLIDLVNKTASKTAPRDIGKDRWVGELFDKLPKDEAEEAYLKIRAESSVDKVFDYILTLHSIEDKRELISSLEQYYYSDFRIRLRQFEAGSFDESIIRGSGFDHFKPVAPDKLKKGIFAIFSFDKWRP